MRKGLRISLYLGEHALLNGCGFRFLLRRWRSSPTLEPEYLIVNSFVKNLLYDNMRSLYISTLLAFTWFLNAKFPRRSIWETYIISEFENITLCFPALFKSSQWLISPFSETSSTRWTRRIVDTLSSALQSRYRNSWGRRYGSRLH